MDTLVRGVVADAIVGALVSGDLAASLVGLSLLGVILLAATVLIVGLRRPAFRTRASNVAVKFVRLFAGEQTP